MVKKILFGNFKGGVGKTTNSVMTAYELAKKGYKTLVCDLDPQANSTQLLRKTYALQHGEDMTVEKTMMVAIKEGDVEQQVKPVMDNLYLLPSFKDFKYYPDFLEQKFMPNEENYKEKRMAYFGELVHKFEDKFDYIIYDVPPTLSIFTDTALFDSDYIVIVMQTQQRSLDGAIAFFEYLQDFYDNHTSIDFDVAGALPVLMKNRARIDTQIIADAKDVFGSDAVFKNIIPHRERLQGYDRAGIQEKGMTEQWDFHDIRLHQLYRVLTEEIIERTGGSNNGNETK
ncbi:ParA family protein [Apilactobacillus xinyiensis]|uniref:ParA family protein n=1 Tax=Apilactobacillus xinyiensis TaxID=2841032 RepID=UPI003364D896